MLHDWLRPGYDYLLEGKISSLWREIDASPIGPDLARYLTGAGELGFSQRVRTATGSQAPARLLIQTGHRLHQLTEAGLDEFADACRMRQHRTGKGWHHYKAALVNTHLVLSTSASCPNRPAAAAPGTSRSASTASLRRSPRR
ncbi:hypothetical protein [Nocardia sp. NPDC047038]|uniref:hypothetical protein n=1 Tax=Nocardia sp. NPDC047038 TaxID=3154338 RepID=UPI0033F2D75D